MRSAGIRDADCGHTRPPALTRNARRSNLKPALLNFPAQETRQEARNPGCSSRPGVSISHKPFIVRDSQFSEDFKRFPDPRLAALAPLIATVEGILFSEALAAEGAVMFPKANWALRDRVEATGQLL